MKPFCVLLISFVLVGCGEDPPSENTGSPDRSSTPQKDAVAAPLNPEPAPIQRTLPKAQKNAVAAIEKLGGSVELNPDYGEVVSVVFAPDTGITDAGLKQLKGLTKLTDLGLDSTQITDAGLQHQWS